MPWWSFGIIAAVLYGLSYPLTERVLRIATWPTIFLTQALVAITVYATVGAVQGSISRDVQTLRDRPSSFALIVFYVCVNITGSILATIAIRGKNATLASLVDASYIGLVPIFSLLLLGKTGLNTGSAAGALLIGVGVAVVIVCG